jgi:hypothetical protein
MPTMWKYGEEVKSLRKEPDPEPEEVAVVERPEKLLSARQLVKKMTANDPKRGMKHLIKKPRKRRK